MSSKWLQGKFDMNNPGKYAGTKQPTFRSSWEFAFMRFCDDNPNVINWASEAIKIPYRNPFTGKQTVYVPDFLVVYQDKNGNKITELIEVKPSSQVTLEAAGRNQGNRASVALNQAKWQAAQHWAKATGVKFRVVTENEIFQINKAGGHFKKRRT